MAKQKDITERVSKVYALLLMGKSKREIVKLITDHYNVCDKTAYIYIDKAKGQRQEDYHEYKEEVMTDQLSHLKNLYEKNYKIQDFKECRAVLSEMRQMLGANAPEKVDQTTKHEGINFNDLIEYVKTKWQVYAIT